MKNHLLKIILLSFFLSTVLLSCSSRRVSMNGLVQRNGVYYEVNSDKPYSGIVFEDYGNNQKALEGHLKDGIQDGNWVRWNSEGQKTFDASYKKGVLDGKMMTWYDNGKIQFDGSYKNGNLDGEITEYTSNGVIAKQSNYKNQKLDGDYLENFESGNKKITCSYKNGLKNGAYTEMFENGENKISCSYSDDLLDGNYIENFQSGRTKSQGAYKHGNFDGFWRTFYENGSEELEGNYIDGKAEGLVKDWYENGGLKTRINYHDGVKNGLCIWYENSSTYADDGKMRLRCYMTNDKMDGFFEWWNSAQSYKHCDYMNVYPDFGCSEFYYKVEGCYINGSREGMFKLWIMDWTEKKQTYFRYLFENNKLKSCSSGTGFCFQYDVNGNLTGPTAKFVDRYDERDLIRKKFDFACSKSIDQTTINSTKNTQNVSTSQSTVNNNQKNSSFGIIKSSKAYFYESPNKNKRAAYLIAGDKIQILKDQDGFIYTEFTGTSGSITKGWVDKNDLSNQNQSSNKSYSDLNGIYIGKIGDKSFVLAIDSVNGNHVSGYDIAGANKRSVTGSCLPNYSSQTVTYPLKLEEPGSDKWDGKFNITLIFSNSKWNGTGFWTAFNNQLSRQIVILQKQ